MATIGVEASPRPDFTSRLNALMSAVRAATTLVIAPTNVAAAASANKPYLIRFCANTGRVSRTSLTKIPYPTKFALGQTYATPGTLEIDSGHRMRCLFRHSRGDWGSVDKEDAATNDEAVKGGFRILSAYPIDPSKPSKDFGDNTCRIITKADRSVTTFLLPSEY